MLGTMQGYPLQTSSLSLAGDDAPSGEAVATEESLTRAMMMLMTDEGDIGFSGDMNGTTNSACSGAEAINIQNNVMYSGMGLISGNTSMVNIGTSRAKRLTVLNDRKYYVNTVHTPQMVSMKYVLENCQTGDLILWNGRDTICKAICEATGSEFSHVSIVVRGPIGGQFKDSEGDLAGKDYPRTFTGASDLLTVRLDKEDRKYKKSTPMSVASLENQLIVNKALGVKGVWRKLNINSPDSQLSKEMRKNMYDSLINFIRNNAENVKEGLKPFDTQDNWLGSLARSQAAADGTIQSHEWLSASLVTQAYEDGGVMNSRWYEEKKKRAQALEEYRKKFHEETDREVRKKLVDPMTIRNASGRPQDFSPRHFSAREDHFLPKYLSPGFSFGTQQLICFDTIPNRLPAGVREGFGGILNFNYTAAELEKLHEQSKRYF